MLSISTRFLSLLVVLLALSAVELELSQQHSQLVSAAPIQARNPNHSISSNSGSEHHRRGRATKPRVGIVVKPGSKVSLSGGAIKARSFQRDSQDGVRTLPLTKIRANIQGKEPLMLFQHHLNRANSKLAAIGKRSLPTKADLDEALEIRKQSILLQRRGISIEKLDQQSRSISSLSPQNRQHHFSHGQGAGSPSRSAALQSPQHKRIIGKHGRLGYTKNANTGMAGNAKRLVGGLLGGLLGGGSAPEEGPAPVASSSSAAPSTTATETSSSSSAPAQESSTSTSSASSLTTGDKKGHSQKHHGGSASHSAAASDAQSGYSQAALQAATSGNLTPANPPAAEDSLGLDIEANDVGYIANIEIGTPLTKFRMLIDSGSADTWVASTACTQCGDSHQKLGKSFSSSFKASTKKFSITYGTGSVSGIVGSDNLSIAGMNLTDHEIGLAHVESKDFSDPSVPFDGLMGLAREQLSNSQVPTPIDSLYAAKLVPAPVMGYHLGRVSDGGNGTNDGEVTFGGVDATKFVGDLVEIPNVSTQGFWEGALSGVYLSSNGDDQPKDLGLTNRTAILDTGTTLIVAPTKDADAVHQSIPGSRSDGQGGYYIPCTFNQTLSLAFDGTSFDLDPRDMTFLPVDENNLQGDCVSSISSGQVGQENEWLVGAAFLKNVYFATNTKSNTIGLAKLTQEANAA